MLQQEYSGPPPSSARLLDFNAREEWNCVLRWQSLREFLVKTRSLALIALLLGSSLLVSAYAFRPNSTDSTHVDECRGRLAELENRIALLEKQRNDLANKIASLNKQISDSESKISSLQSQIGSDRQQIAKLSDEIEGLRGQIQSLDAEISRTRASLNTAEQELRQTNIDLQNANARVQALQNDLNSQRSTLDRYRNARAQAESVWSSLVNEYNQRADAYNKRVETFNQKLTEYTERRNKLWQSVGAWVLACMIAAVIAYYSGGSGGLEAVSYIFSFMATFGFSTPANLLTEYNSLRQLEDWLKNERSYLESESRQLGTLKARLDEADRTLQYWRTMVQNQENVVARTEADLNYWIQKRDELTRNRDQSQANVDSLRGQLNSMTSRRTQLQSSFDTRLSTKRELEISVAQKESEIKALQQSVSESRSNKDAAESELSETEASLAPARTEADGLRQELFLVSAQPYLIWGGMSFLALFVLAFLVMVRKHEIDVSRLNTLADHLRPSVVKFVAYAQRVRDLAASNIVKARRLVKRKRVKRSTKKRRGARRRRKKRVSQETRHRREEPRAH
jgi:septal ring factor EnvC (AmiA/AmiB activator)